jgi:Wzt C-terminal domain
MGRTIIFVSHDLAAVERLCDRAVLLRRGEIVHEGNPRDVALEYQRCTLVASGTPAHVPTVSRVIELTHFSYCNASDRADQPVRTGEAMTVEIGYFAHETLTGVVFNVYVYWPSGYLCTQLTTGEQGATIEKGAGRVRFFCPIVNLRPGLFPVDIAAERYPEFLDCRSRCGILRVDEGPFVFGDLHMPHGHRIEREGGESCLIGQDSHPSTEVR